MTQAATSRFGSVQDDARRLHRALTWSFAVHVGIVAVLVLVPREWLSRHEPPAHVMTISLGGTPGPRTTGQTSIGGHTVQEVAPPPRRPVVPRPVPPPAEPVPLPPKPAAPPPRPARTPQPPARETKAAARATRPARTPAPAPPVTGRQVFRGNTPVDTGVLQTGAGLSFGGGTGGETNLADFCCPDYLAQVASTIASHWQRQQEERGLTVIRFTIQKDGTIADITIEQSSGSGLLDRASRSAVVDSRLPPLPPGYAFDALTVHLRFPYGVQ
jgi:TonB family protein